MDAEIKVYMAWLHDRVEKQSALARELAFEQLVREMVREEIREAGDP
jgi:hypothetical protein